KAHPGLLVEELESRVHPPQDGELCVDAIRHPLWNFTFLPKPLPGLTSSTVSSASVCSLLSSKTSTICWSSGIPPRDRISGTVIVSLSQAYWTPSMLISYFGPLDPARSSSLTLMFVLRSFQSWPARASDQ